MLKNIKRARKRRSQRIKTDTVRVEPLTWIQIDPLKQKRRRGGGSETAMRRSAAQEQLRATGTEAVRRGRAASDIAMTETLSMTVGFHQRNAGAQTTLMAVVTTPHLHPVQLTTISMDTQETVTAEPVVNTESPVS